jgi:hypothetical protein
MADVLSAEWCAALTAAVADLAPRPSAGDADVDVVAGSRRVRFSVRAGRLASVAPLADGDEPAPVEVPMTAEAVGAMVAGELDPAMAYMRGDLKPVGPTGAVLDWLSALADPACRSALAGASAPA